MTFCTRVFFQLDAEAKNAAPLAIWPKKILSALFTASAHSADDDRQNGPAGRGYYQLTDDGAEIDALQGWDQGLEN